MWVDPIDLAGFPQDLIWSLFAQPDKIVDLHVAELTLAPGGKPVTILLQPGRFRLSGGTIALRPGFGSAPLKLTGVTEVATGARIEGHNGQFIIDIHGPARYRLNFGKALETMGDKQ